MFNDKFGLTQAVLEGRKTQTRRIIKDKKLDFAISHFGIDNISGKGTWESNPWVFVYEFELID